MFEVELVFHGDLIRFLRGRSRGSMRRALVEKTAVKDVIEACGVPHTEVDLIVDAEDAHDFSWHVQRPASLEIHPVPAPADVLPHAPRLQRRHCARFVADCHLGKLARNLRLLGMDTIYERDADDAELLDCMRADDRALLTRDRPLLMNSIVNCGYCPRSDDPEEQTRELLRRFPAGETKPFTRCLQCNGWLESVPKSDVLGPLSGEPRTLRYYEAFHRCQACGKIYWAGTHFAKLNLLVQRLLCASDFAG